MRGLWLMAARLRACHCRVCLRATNNVSRPSTECRTTSYPRRRKTLASRVFTAYYSTVIPTAFTLDAWPKDKHTTEASRSLIAALESISARDLAQAIASTGPDTVFYEHSLERNHIINYICNMQPEFLLNVDTEYQNKLAVRFRERRRVGADWWKIRDSVGASTLIQCERILVGEENNPRARYREPKTEKQMLRYVDMINALVDSLLTEAYWVTEAEAPGSHPSLSSPDSVMTMIRLLRSEGYPRYNHPDLDPEATTSARARLNEVNLKILADWVSPHRERCVAKICYNFLVCSVPPGIQNYNTLMLAFTQLGEHDLAHVVVDSFLFDSHMRPTEATILCLLQHYRLSKDIVGFWRILRRVFGHDPRGIGLRRRTTEDLEQDGYVGLWVEEQGVTAVNDYFVERPPFTQSLVETMMEGLMDFGLLREAAKLLAICLQERWDVDPELLNRLLYQCLNALHIGAARVVIQSILDNLEQAMDLFFGPKSVPVGTIAKLRHLLSVCYATSLPDRSTLGPGVDPQVLESRSSNSTRLKHLVTAMLMRSVWPHNGVLAKRMRIAMTGITQKPFSGQFNDGVNVGISIVDDLARVQRKRDSNLAKSEHVRYLAKAVWLETQFHMVKENTTGIEHLVCGTLIDQIPAELVKKNAHFNPEIPIGQRIARIMRYFTPGTDEYQRVMCFIRKQKIDDRVNALLMDALPASHAEPLRLLLMEEEDPTTRNRLLYSHFERYLRALRNMRSPGTQTAGWAGAFSGLLAKLPKPSLAFWRRAPETEAVSSGQ
ncbi:hypothetical protein MMYC01_200744 [Madurella mycetomatis]|uniref:Pentatricopeptide repeat domain-containing protein n=1 Tax=Madurella mycetomatis TaxID=100816 RepID=A0A175WGT4_9PEZI|nr:hypothetical protein MMYC01_200744 [Madurella mycetomatis]